MEREEAIEIAFQVNESDEIENLFNEVDFEFETDE